MVCRVVCIALMLALVACATPEPIVTVQTVTVEKPIPVKASPPAELAAAYQPLTLPQFIAPSAPGAAAALDEQGLQQLREILRVLTGRDAAWRAWAGEPNGR